MVFFKWIQFTIDFLHQSNIIFPGCLFLRYWCKFWWWTQEYERNTNTYTKVYKHKNQYKIMKTQIQIQFQYDSSVVLPPDEGSVCCKPGRGSPKLPPDQQRPRWMSQRVRIFYSVQIQIQIFQDFGEHGRKIQSWCSWAWPTSSWPSRGTEKFV